MHIHPSSPNSDTALQSEENAAIKIQAGFRGYRVRKQLNQTQCKRKSLNGYQRSLLRSRSKRQHLTTIMSTDNDRSRDANCHGGVSGSSIGIGIARLNGNHNNNNRRNDANEVTVEERSATKIQAGIRGYLVRKKQKLAADAATKIQAGFRGFKARKEAQKLRQM